MRGTWATRRTWGTRSFLVTHGAKEHEPCKIFGVDDADNVLRAAGLVVNRDARTHVLDDLCAGGFDARFEGSEKIFWRGVMISRMGTSSSSRAR